jgi:hypothetical protein
MMQQKDSRVDETMAKLIKLGIAALLVTVGGCATITGSDKQVLMVHTIQDSREVYNVGCVLTNDAGRWFVTAPGRVSVQKSAGNLWVDCRVPGASVGQEMVASRASTGAAVGNVVLTAGLGYLVDKRTGAGFDYPDTLTVLMRSSTRAAEPEQAINPGNVVY